MRYVGYHDAHTLPFKRGEKVVIPAGTRVRSYNPSKKEWFTTRKQVVAISMIMPGMSANPGFQKRRDIEQMCEGKAIDVNDHYFRWEFMALQAREEQDQQISSMLYREYREYKIPVDNPTVQWAGTGGYWTWVDINDILAANSLQEAA